MSGAQKIIKYLAIALAISLIVSIISGIATFTLAISEVYNKEKDSVIEDELKNLKELQTTDNIELLDINITSNMIIKVGDIFKVETNSKYINCKQNQNMIYINEKKHNLLNSDKSILMITIPENILLTEVNINSGAGKIEIEKLAAKILNLDLGAGKVTINNLDVINEGKINGGAGELTISDSKLNDLDLDLGIGKFTFKGILLGNVEIDHGVGEVELNLVGNKEEYQIHLDKGIGSTTIDGESIKDDETIGLGPNKIDIDGGVGSINIDFFEE